MISCQPQMIIMDNNSQVLSLKSSQPPSVAINNNNQSTIVQSSSGASTGHMGRASVVVISKQPSTGSAGGTVIQTTSDALAAAAAQVSFHNCLWCHNPLWILGCLWMTTIISKSFPPLLMMMTLNRGQLNHDDCVYYFLSWWHFQFPSLFLCHSRHSCVTEWIEPPFCYIIITITSSIPRERMEERILLTTWCDEEMWCGDED